MRIDKWQEKRRRKHGNRQAPQSGCVAKAGEGEEGEADCGPGLAGEAAATRTGEATRALGYKVVYFRYGEHWPMTKDQVWSDLQLEAKCILINPTQPSSFGGIWTYSPSMTGGAGAFGNPHHAPHKDCCCGIYVCPDLPKLIPYWSELPQMRADHRALVLVGGWGKSIQHELGWRCENAQILDFITDASAWGFPASLSLEQAEELLAAEYPERPRLRGDVGLGMVPWLSNLLPTAVGRM